MGGISSWQLLIVALIIILVFGTKRLGGIGSDLGHAIKGFKKAIGDNEYNKEENTLNSHDTSDKSSSYLQGDKTN
ncbi:twin-arginine translocase TatA/TatE family subunit [Vibrio sp. FNV 38]|nr:twin-arginine translocase TatA/TatE family subunit [Vibrio sp. FNV 38]